MCDKEVVYHGSSKLVSSLIPHQAWDIGFEAGCQNAVYATTNMNMAIAFALGGIPDENNELEREMMPEQGDIMTFKKGTPNYGGVGYVYVLNKADFIYAMGSQWVSDHEVFPIEIIKINVDDYLHLIRISR